MRRDEPWAAEATGPETEETLSSGAGASRRFHGPPRDWMTL